MPSASSQPSVIDQYLRTEREKGRVGGPFLISPIPNLHVSRFGVILKKHQPGKWRLTLDLSSPLGHSVDDDILRNPFLFSTWGWTLLFVGSCPLAKLHFWPNLLLKVLIGTYLSIQRTAICLARNGRAITSSIWLFPLGYVLHPLCFLLLQICQSGNSDNYGLNFLLHYLDDFNTLGPPNSFFCQNNLDTCIRLFKAFIPLHPDKVEGPSTCLAVLGIELYSLILQGRLPHDKFERIVALLESWSVGRHCSKKELESLLGTLHHACKVISQGHTSIRRMINFLSAFRRDDYPIRLNEEFHLDLSWWREFFISWDRLSFLLPPLWASLPDFSVSSDAAGALGYGAISGHDWFVGKWSTAQQHLSIRYKELFSFSRDCLALGSHMGHKTGGVLFG